MIFNKLSVLSEQEIERILDASYRILEEVGFKFEWAPALELLRDHGCKVDLESRMAWVPRSLTLDAIKNMPTLAAPQEYPKLFWAPWIGMNIIDHETHTRRPGLLRDCEDTINVVNHLENISVSSTGVVPQDVPIQLADVYMAELLFKYSEKIFTTWTYTVETSRDILEMALAVTGGEKELKESRIINYLAEPVSPLQLSRHSLQIMKLYGEKDQPINMGPMVMAGTTGPATLAGAVALQMAEDLAGLVYLFCLGSRSPVALGGPMHVADMRTGACLYGAPELSLIHLAIVACAHHLGFMSGCTSGLTDANCLDFQNGWERGLTGVMLWAAGSESLGMRGQIGAAQGFSIEQIVIENEMAGMLQRISQGIVVDDDTLALDVIEKVGIGGNFLQEKHTLKHVRDFWQPRLFKRDTFEKYWKDYKHLEDRARERVREILAAGKLELQVSEDISLEIDRIKNARMEKFRNRGN